MAEKKSEEVKARDARLKKIREQEGDLQVKEAPKKDVAAKDVPPKKT